MRVLLDVSTSVAWRRPPVGIVRVEQEFAKFLLGRSDIDARFCRYDRVAGHHVEMPRADVEAMLAAPTEPLAPACPLPAEPVASDPMRLRLRRRVASGLHRAVDRLPASVRTDALGFARAADNLLRSLYWLSMKIGRRDGDEKPGDEEKLHAPPPFPDVSGLEVARGSIYVSMGLDWDFNDLQAVWAMKQAHGTRVILVVHDVIPILFPELTPSDSRDAFARYFVDLAHVADRVVAVSQTSRDDFARFLEDVTCPAPRMQVINSGSDVRTRASAKTSPPLAELTKRPFVLCVSTFEARKNHELLYHLWERLVSTHGDRAPLLVLVGMFGWGTTDLLNRIRINRTLAGKILLFSELPDGELFWLYEHCLFTVFPSLYEGWGLPVVESLALGVPCLASSAPSVVEATQGLFPTIDPLDFSAWLAHVERWSFDPAAREAVRATLRARYRVTSWSEHGEALLTLAAELSAEALPVSADAPQPDAPARVLRA